MSTNQLNKIQIKAEILTVLSKLQTNLDNAHVESILSTLSEQQDKTAILEILTKELSKASEQKAILICFLMLKLIESKEVEKTLWDTLKNPGVSDITKTIVLNVLKDMGNKINYEQLDEYVENPNEIIDAETQKLLQTAIINPEAQIDFLDFLNSLSENDKKILVESLAEDYSLDSLANILSPIALYATNSPIGKIAINELGASKSQLALHALYETLDFTQDEELISLIKKNISKLKISGVREDNTIDFYKTILSATKPFSAYSSYPDGHGNQALIFSRERENETLQMVAIVINDNYGVVDCFGFNEISKSEFTRIVDRFYNGDNHIYIDFRALKKLLNNAEKISRKNENNLSYEYICWKTLLADIESEQIPIELILKPQLELKNLSQQELEKIFMMDLIQRWFLDTEYNDRFKEIVEQINTSIKENNFTFDLEETVKNNYEQVFDEEEKNLLDKRILTSAYLKYLANEKEEATLLYALYQDEDAKKELSLNILRKSFYEYYMTLKFKQKESSKMTNIFTSRNKKDNDEPTAKQIDLILNMIESIWVEV